MFAEHADLAFTVGGAVLTVGLIPTVRARTIMPYASTLPIASVLTAWLPFQWALGLEFGAATTAVQAAMWWGLVALKWRRGRAFGPRTVVLKRGCGNETCGERC